MEKTNVPVEEKPVVVPEKVIETPIEVPKPRTGISKVIVPFLILLVIVLGVVVYVLFNRISTGLEPERVPTQPMETIKEKFLKCLQLTQPVG